VPADAQESSAGLGFDSIEISNMKHYLLIGAGFSHNWGGWLASEAFEYLLGDPAVVGNREIRELLWKHQPQGGFEAALDELQRGSAVSAKRNEAELRFAIARMFDAMNSAFKSSSLEFGDWIGNQRPVRDFLVRFDAIFSLNQDLLLEHQYRGTADGLVDRDNPRTQKSWQLPGMRMIATLDTASTYPAETGLWVPSGDQMIAPDQQPIFKLHGSSNWRAAEGSEVMILGGGKSESIARFPVLHWYSEVFRDCTAQPDARVMVIGYGFRDDHINTILERAIGRGLKVFIIGPDGAYAGDSSNLIPRGGIGYRPTNTQQKLMEALIGASRRPLSSTLSRDHVEHQKLERFFQA
jgi:SIR2-like protein